jgi:hypothetical protein
MNRLNLMRVQLHGGKLVNSTDHIALASVSNRSYGFGRPPAWTESDAFTSETAAKLDPAAREFADDPLSLAASRAMLALPALDHTMHQINGDARLSPSGRQEKLAEPRTAAIKAIATAAAAVAAHGQALQTREADFYAPPKLTASDVQAGLEDRELRDSWRTSPTSKRTQMLQQMQAGHNERMLAALVRSPIPLETHEGALVKDAWAATVEKREPKKAGELKAARANQDWADSVVRAAAQYAPRATGLTPAEITAAAKDTGGESIFFNNGLPAVDAA